MEREKKRETKNGEKKRIRRVTTRSLNKKRGHKKRKQIKKKK